MSRVLVYMSLYRVCFGYKKSLMCSVLRTALENPSLNLYQTRCCALAWRCCRSCSPKGKSAANQPPTTDG